MSDGIMIVGCLHGLSSNRRWKKPEHADNTTCKEMGRIKFKETVT